MGDASGLLHRTRPLTRVLRTLHLATGMSTHTPFWSISPFIGPFIGPVIHSLVHSLVHRSIHWCIHWCTHSFTRTRDIKPPHWLDTVFNSIAFDPLSHHQCLTVHITSRLYRSLLCTRVLYELTVTR